MFIPSFKAVTPEGWKCFFGYYDKSAHDVEDKLLLFHRVDFQDRAPGKDDKARICMVELETGKTEVLGETHAWNFQQGSMLQWLSKEEIIYNTRVDGKFAARILNINSARERTIERAVSAVSPDGRSALSLNFARLAVHRPGYGYEGVEDEFSGRKWPDEDGLHIMNLESGESRLLIPVSSLLGHRSEKNAGDRFAWVNHTLFSPDGEKFVFLNRWQNDEGWFNTRLFVSGVEGGSVTDLLESCFISHFDWKNGRELFVWAEIGGRKGFWLVDVETKKYRCAYDNMQVDDGHGSYNRDGSAVLIDTYPLEDGCRRLRVFDAVAERQHELGRFISPPEITGPIRCDLHPRWSFSEKFISFDSAHEGLRRVYAGEVLLKPTRRPR